MYRCRVFDVWEGAFSLPDGRNIRQSWIDHKPCIAVVPVTSDGRLLLIRQYRHATGQMLTEIPAGAMDRDGEWAEDCVQRELADKYAGGVKIAKLNIDENPMITSQYTIRSIPTMLLFKDGKLVNRLVGALPKEEIEHHLLAIMKTN